MTKSVFILLSVFLLSCGGGSGDNGGLGINDIPTLQDGNVQGKLGQTVTCADFSDFWDATCTDGVDSGQFFMTISQDSCSEFFIDADIFSVGVGVGQAGNVSNCTQDSCYSADWNRGNTGFSATSVFRDGPTERVTSQFDIYYVTRDQLLINISNTSNLNAQRETFSCTLDRAEISQGGTGN